MLTLLPYGYKSIKVPNLWEDIQVRDFVRFTGIDVPTELEEAIVNGKLAEVSMVVLHDYYAAALGALMGTDGSKFKEFDSKIFIQFVHEHLLHFVSTCITGRGFFTSCGMTMEFKPATVKHVVLDNTCFKPPSSMVVRGDVILWENAMAVQFTEACDLLLQHKDNQRAMWQDLPLLCSIYLRDTPLPHTWDTERVVKQAELFGDLNMATALYVLHTHIQLWDVIKEMNGLIFNPPKQPNSRPAPDELRAFGMRGLVYELAVSGMVGRVGVAEQVPVYDFFHMVKYLRARTL